MGNRIMEDSKERFSNRVNNYIKFRPHYPEGIIRILQEKINLDKNWVIADIGSGTGISSERFIHNGNTVFGVEPNREMREAAEDIYKNAVNFKSFNGSAEDTKLTNKSIDMIIAGQAFHWFDMEKSRLEFKRILKNGCYTVLIWNERKSVESPFLSDYEKLIKKFGKDYEKVNHKNISADSFDKFFGHNNYKIEILDNCQLLNWEGLRGRLLSSSYAPLENGEGYDEMIGELQAIFNKHKSGETISFDYFTRLYYGKLD